MMNLNSFLLVFLGGGLGASLRFIIGELSSNQFWGVLVPNLIGCALIGCLINLIGSHEQLKLVFIVGFLGGFTTFSSYMLFLGQTGLNLQALSFFLLHNVLGFLCFYVSYKAFQ